MKIAWVTYNSGKSKLKKERVDMINKKKNKKIYSINLGTVSYTDVEILPQKLSKNKCKILQRMKTNFYSILQIAIFFFFFDSLYCYSLVNIKKYLWKGISFILLQRYKNLSRATNGVSMGVIDLWEE